MTFDEHDVLTHEEEIALGKRIAAGGEDAAVARDRLIACNLRLVASIAKAMNRVPEDMDDDFQGGVIGLMNATRKYDHTRGFKFSTYATYWIRQSIQRCQRTREALVVPVHVYHKRQESLPAYAVTALRKLPRRLTDQDITELVLGSTPSAVDETADLEEVQHLADKVLAEAGLSERERAILRLNNGMDGKDPITLKEIGDRFGVCRERIRQVHEVAMKKVYRATYRNPTLWAAVQTHLARAI